MICNDNRIMELVDEHRMIEPFLPHQVRSETRRDPTVPDVNVTDYKRVISYGLSSFGYDIRLGTKFKVFTDTFSTVVDPKNFDPRCFVEVEGSKCIIPPRSFVLGHSVEYFRIPKTVMTICLGKSTYARCGIVVNVTPFEPGWEGQATLEFSNTTPLPAVIYANEGCAQVLFFEGVEPRVTYDQRRGKYQGQEGVVPPRI